MSDLQAQFTQAAADAQNLPSRPSNDTMLLLYALYKQATSGDVQGSRPGFTNPIGRAKYDAWTGQKGKTKDAAMTEYIALVNKLKG
jgi:diazepam-binding inhibitor (GABA receptor modulator, acyl-CoA-binding protein)